MTRSGLWSCWTGAVLAVAAAGCSLPGQRAGFDADNPTERTLALAKAAREDDRSKIPQIIGMLDSSDPGVRMLAIRTLERMTGETFGYDYAAPEPERRAAAEAWAVWAKPRNGGPAGIPRAGEPGPYNPGR